MEFHLRNEARGIQRLQYRLVPPLRGSLGCTENRSHESRQRARRITKRPVPVRSQHGPFSCYTTSFLIVYSSRSNSKASSICSNASSTSIPPSATYSKISSNSFRVIHPPTVGSFRAWPANRPAPLLLLLPTPGQQPPFPRTTLPSARLQKYHPGTRHRLFHRHARTHA